MNVRREINKQLVQAANVEQILGICDMEGARMTEVNAGEKTYEQLSVVNGPQPYNVKVLQVCQWATTLQR